ncbi:MULTISPECIES: hypothetical protein [unclassified Streptomyces]|uniref:hypothetical protein n=1 Tax=unclassified Streptomyces TaxID=2593676 RepID=UPI00278BC4C5|nr:MULTISPECIES: hypothetical protein [unclassified Streptomyces]
MLFNPPNYAWAATTVREAQEFLDAAGKMLDAHMASLAPGSQGVMQRERETPVEMTLTLHRGPLVERINDKRTVEALAEDFEA